jgi:acyl carrier protein
VVVAREDVAGDKRLVAYVVAERESVDEWRQHLKQQLPEYMAPSSYVVSEKLPLTPNGKVDRRALPMPEQTARVEAKEHVAPRTAAEEIVGGIWCEILGLKEISINDNFFELGGHSLLGTQVISRVQETFEVEMPLRSLFEHPTLSEFSMAIEAKIVESIETLTEEEALAML